jgi:di/tricarboxylate transporter
VDFFTALLVVISLFKVLLILDDSTIVSNFTKHSRSYLAARIISFLIAVANLKPIHIAYLILFVRDHPYSLFDILLILLSISLHLHRSYSSRIRCQLEEKAVQRLRHVDYFSVDVISI